MCRSPKEKRTRGICPALSLQESALLFWMMIFTTDKSVALITSARLGHRNIPKISDFVSRHPSNAMTDPVGIYDSLIARIWPHLSHPLMFTLADGTPGPGETPRTHVGRNDNRWFLKRDCYPFCKNREMLRAGVSVFSNEYGYSSEGRAKENGTPSLRLSIGLFLFVTDRNIK